MEKLCRTPNQYAQKPSLVVRNDRFIVKGYQSYVVYKDGALTTGAKKASIYDNFVGKKLKDKSVLDLGGANGFYSVLAYFRDAKDITLVDMDAAHLNIVSQINDHFDMGINIINKNIDEIDLQADVVNALALIHWIYSCTTLFGSLDESVKFLRDRTKEMLVIEWIDPKDKNIKFFNHIRYNLKYIYEPYNFRNFMKAISKYFSDWRDLGNVNPTRKLFLCIV